MYALQKDLRYLVAVSFGPDSMALLHMLLQEHLEVIVCHVNYHKRKESEEEEARLRKFCEEYHLPLFVLRAPNPPKQVNFQAWARDVRYRFFASTYQKYHANALLVAHHLDDDLETYFMQRRQNKILSYYGLRYERMLYGMRVLRPLLDMRKHELQDYCMQHQVPYAIDSSNLTDNYERNRIRHHILEKASLDDISQWKKEKEQWNALRAQQLQHIQHVFYDKTIHIPLFLKLNEEEQLLCLHQFITRVLFEYTLSRDKAMMMIQAAWSPKPNWRMKLIAPYEIVKAYHVLYLHDSTLQMPYHYVLLRPDILDTPYFTLDFRKDTSNRNIDLHDYPITIRPYQKGDKMEIGNVLKSVNRQYIDWKMPQDIRTIWPVFINKEGKIVYVPRYRDSFRKEKETNLVVKCKLGI